MLSVNLVEKGKLKQAAGCLRDFLGKVEEFCELRGFAEERGLDFKKGNLCWMGTFNFVLIYILSSC